MLFYFSYFYFIGDVTCRILVPPPGIEPMPPTMEAQSRKHWTTREVYFILKVSPLVIRSRMEDYPVIIYIPTVFMAALLL